MALIIGNGKIDFREFVNMMILNGEQIAWNENDLVEAFRTFDTENKGRSMLDSNVLTLSLDFFYPRWLPIYRAIHLTENCYFNFSDTSRRSTTSKTSETSHPRQFNPQSVLVFLLQSFARFHKLLYQTQVITVLQDLRFKSFFYVAPDIF